MDSTLGMLASIPLFAELDAEALSAFAEARVSRRFPKNATILNEGDSTDAIYIINKGRVKVCKTSVNGKEVVLAVLSSGDHFGEMSLIDEKPRSASVVTKEPCELTVIRKQDFTRILMGNPRFALTMMRGLSERLRAADRSIESLALMDVYGRIARVLLDLAKPKDGKLVVEEPLTHKDIAQMVGSSREMVSRIFKDLVAGDYISTKQKVITIKSRLPRGW